MRFLVDAQLPPALARRLASRGIETRHVADCGLLTASDPQIWEYASANDFVVLTKDEDFALRRTASDIGPVVVWLRTGNTRNAELLARVDGVLSSVLDAITRGETLIELY